MVKPTPTDALNTLFKATTYMKATLEEHQIFALCFSVLENQLKLQQKGKEGKIKTLEKNGVDNENAII